AEQGMTDAERLAKRLARGLLSMAHQEDDHFSWGAYPSDPRAHNLTGFSHGASGVGYALAKYYAFSGDEKARQAAEGAFAYERSVYLPDEMNWPDYSKPGDGHYHGRLSWCHGAPGIG